MNKACIIKLEFSFHDLENNQMLPSESKSGKYISVIYSNSEDEFMEKINKIIEENKMINMRVK